jgi:hypothetical protein
MGWAASDDAGGDVGLPVQAEISSAAASTAAHRRRVAVIYSRRLRLVEESHYLRGSAIGADIALAE